MEEWLEHLLLWYVAFGLFGIHTMSDWHSYWILLMRNGVDMGHAKATDTLEISTYNCRRCNQKLFPQPENLPWTICQSHLSSHTLCPMLSNIFEHPNKKTRL
jgi:hypothetical protein